MTQQSVLSESDARTAATVHTQAEMIIYDSVQSEFRAFNAAFGKYICCLVCALLSDISPANQPVHRAVGGFQLADRQAH